MVKQAARHLVTIAGLTGMIFQMQMAQASALDQYPADADIPEEILRTEIIVEARSPLTGELLTAAEYAQLQARLAGANRTPQLNSDIRQLVYLLRLRRVLKPIIPFIKEQPAEAQQTIKEPQKLATME